MITKVRLEEEEEKEQEEAPGENAIEMRLTNKELSWKRTMMPSRRLADLFCYHFEAMIERMASESPMCCCPCCRCDATGLSGMTNPRVASLHLFRQKPWLWRC